MTASASVPGVWRGSRLGACELGGELGRGGAGVVHRAWHHGLGREVAVKVTRAGRHATGRETERLLCEAITMAGLRHPVIPSVHDVGTDHGVAFFAIELLHGMSLSAALARGPLPVADVLRLGAALARGLDHVHRRGVLHRDIKPANIVMRADAWPALIDFGLAITAACRGCWRGDAGARAGTPGYMAPEQARGDIAALGPHTDVYGLGAVLCAALSGQPPARAPKTWMTDMQSSGISDDVIAICQRATHERPADRYAGAAAMADELERATALRAVSSGA